MDYLDYFDRQELIKERARCSSELNQLKVKKESDESVEANVENVKNQLNEIIKYCKVLVYKLNMNFIFYFIVLGVFFSLLFLGL